MEISVVLPFFNAEKTLARAIESIINQSFWDFELILVDNNSTDGSQEIAKAYQRRDQRIKLVQEKNQGVAYASNCGFEMACTPFIARMDADDEMVPQRLERQVNYLKSRPEIGLIGGQVTYRGSVENIGFQHYVDWSNGLSNSEDIYLNQFVELPIVNPTIMFRKAVFAQLGGYRHGEFPEDYEMILRWLEQGVLMDKIDETVLDWYDHEERLTRTDNRYSDIAFFQVKATYLARWLKKEAAQKELWIWGAGKLSRRRSDFLKDHGIEIKGYIDVKSRQLDLPCIDFRDIPKPGKRFILSYVSNRGKREEVRQYLIKRGYLEGKDFLLAA